MLTQVVRKLLVVTACNQQNMHPHLHISISSPLYPVLPLTLRQNGSKTCMLWFVAYVPNWATGHKDYAQWSLDCVWQENPGSVPLLQKTINSTLYNKFSLGQSHPYWSSQHLIQWKALLAVKVTEYSPINIKIFCNGTSCLPVLLTFLL